MALSLIRIKMKRNFRIYSWKEESDKGVGIGSQIHAEREKSLFRIHPKYGYRESGYPPTIPSNAWLEFEIKLIDIKEKLKEKYKYEASEKMEFA